MLIFWVPNPTAPFSHSKPCRSNPDTTHTNVGPTHRPRILATRLMCQRLPGELSAAHYLPFNVTNRKARNYKIPSSEPPADRCLMSNLESRQLAHSQTTNCQRRDPEKSQATHPQTRRVQFPFNASTSLHTGPGDRPGTTKRRSLNFVELKTVPV